MGQLSELQIKAARPRHAEYLLADGEGLYLRVADKVYQKGQLNAAGDCYAGSGDFTYCDTAGTKVAGSTFTVTARRIGVQAPR